MNDPTAFTRVCNVIMIILCIGCIVFFALSFRGGEVNMMGFPVLFLLAALMQFFRAWQNIRRDIRGRNHKGAAAGHVIVGIAMLLISYIMVLCLW